MSRDPYSPTWPWEPSEMAAIKDAVERSSLGTPEAKALRASVSDERAAAVVARAKELDAERSIVVSRLSGYFLGPDAHDELWLWRERGDYPVPILSRHELRNDPDVWDLIVAAADPAPDGAS